VLSISLLLVAVASLLLWHGVVAPAIMRLVGVPLRGGFWRTDLRNQHLSKGQYVWAFGIFTWGIGMFLFMNVWDYLQWRVIGDTFLRLDAKHVALTFLIWVVAGCFVGFAGYRHRRDAELSSN
jgi:FtsH-binding integral membrane protein